MADRVFMEPAWDTNGKLVPGAVASFFEAGTTNPLAVFADQAATIQLGSTVTADASGFFPDVYTIAAVKKDVKSPAGVSLPGFPSDAHFVVPSAGVGASTITHQPNENNSAANVQDAINNNSSLLSLVSAAGAGDVVGTTATQTLANKTLTDPAINLGSDAVGDIYYRASDGSFERLAKGTQGYLLRAGPDFPEWAEHLNFGVDQSWQDVRSLRGGSTSFQNTTGRAIMVSITPSNDGIISTAEVSANGANFVAVGILFGLSSDQRGVSFIVPNGHFYRLNNPSANPSVWAELR